MLAIYTVIASSWIAYVYLLMVRRMRPPRAASWFLLLGVWGYLIYVGISWWHLDGMDVLVVALCILVVVTFSHHHELRRLRRHLEPDEDRHPWPPPDVRVK